ncbi:MAG: outer membrane protein transport protein [Polyangiaceae bacterium]
MRRARLTALLVAAWLLGSSRAYAETGDAFYFSSNAALSAGAVTADTRDIGAVWYNPAGLAGSIDNQISLSGFVYGLRLRSLPDVLRSKLPGGYRSASLESSNIFSVPNATVYARRITDDVSVGFGIYVTERDTRTAWTSDRYSVSREQGGLSYPANVRQHLDTSLDHTKYALGPAVGWRLTPNFRVGASVFVTYTQRTVTTGYQVDVTQADAQNPSVDFLMRQNRISSTEAGVVSTLGIQWDATPTWRFGLTLRMPEHRFHQTSEGEFVTGSGREAPGDDDDAKLSTVPADASGVSGLKVPPRIVLAASHRFRSGAIVSVEGDYRPALRSAATSVVYRNVGNVRVGFRAPLGKQFVLGAGAFTDRDQLRLLDAFTSEQIDRYGGTVGVTLLTPFSTRDEAKRDGSLVLATTVALRYAAGLGQVRGIDLDLASQTSTLRTFRVTYHELLPFIGTSISF